MSQRTRDLVRISEIGDSAPMSKGLKKLCEVAVVDKANGFGLDWILSRRPRKDLRAPPQV